MSTPREVGPSVVGKLEYDLDFLRGAQDDQMLRAQIAVGF